MSVFAEPLAQVREATVRNGVCLVCGSGVLDGEHLRDDLGCALARVERLATDYETGLEKIADGSWNISGPGIHTAASFARAVLSAREES